MLRNEKGQFIVDNTKLGSLSYCEWLYWIQHELHRQQPLVRIFAAVQLDVWATRIAPD